MKLLDVNVMVYAFRRDSERHEEFRGWLVALINGDSAFAISELALGAVVRICTHARIFRRPSTLDEAIDFTDRLRGHPSCRHVQPSAQHWSLFTRLCKQANARGNLVSDAWYAALAIESGCIWMTTDRDYARFPALTWMHPLDHHQPVVNPA